jgi:hypothetical protein
MIWIRNPASALMKPDLTDGDLTVLNQNARRKYTKERRPSDVKTPDKRL